jgi:formylmethanofuran dehydrogenase subunit E
VVIVETDMCGVDAIQYLTGCTFGKGNLIHLDYGKNAFTFIRRSDGKALCIVTRSNAFGPPDPERQALFEQARFSALHRQRGQQVLDAPEEALFKVREVEPHIPERARVMASLVWDACGERAMETRTRRFQGRTLCIPCFETSENRLKAAYSAAGHG